MAQRILGLDIGSWSIKAMVVESSLRRSNLVAFREHHLPLDATGHPMPGELEAAVRKTMAGLEAEHHVCQVSATEVLTREIELPFSDPKRIAQVLNFQLESIIPRPISTLVTDYQLLAKKADGALLLCAAIDQKALSDWIDKVGKAGVNPRTLTVASMALENIAPHVTRVAHDAPAGAVNVLVDVGHRSTTVTIIAAGKVQAFRTFARAGHQITLALARKFELSYQDAEGIKHRAVTVEPTEAAAQGDARVRQYSEIAIEAVEPLIRDLRMTLDSLIPPGSERGAMTLFGGSSRLIGLAEVIGQATGFDVELARAEGPMWSPEVAGQAHAASSGLVAAALALEPLSSDDRHRINLRKDELAYGSDFDAIRSKIGWMVAFALLLVTAHFVRLSVHISELNKQEAKLGERLAAHLERIGEGDFATDQDVPGRFAMALDLISIPPEDESNQVYPGMTAFHAFYETTVVQHAINEGFLPDELFDDEGKVRDDRPPVAELKQVELQSFLTDGKNITITGTGFDIDVIEAFKSKLSEVACFKQVERQETRATSNRERPNWRDFTLKAELKCDRPQPVERTASKAVEEKP